MHQEATIHLDRTLTHIRSRGVKAGVALNPATPITTIAEILPILDFVVLMSVNPGFGGQPFLPYVLDKARHLRTIIDQRAADTLIEIDGGIGPRTIADAVAAGVDVCVAGSAVFGTDDPPATMRQLRQLAGRPNP